MQRSYTVKDQAIVLDVDETAIAVSFDPEAPASVKAGLVKEAGAARPYTQGFEIPTEKLTLIPLQGSGRSDAVRSAATDRFSADKSVQIVRPVYRYGTRQLIAPARLLVGVKDIDTGIEAIASDYEMTVIRPITDQEFVVAIREDIDPIDLVMELNDDARLDYAEPDFIIIAAQRVRQFHPLDVSPPIPSRTRFSPNDPLLSDQYAVSLTEANKAWRLVSGDPSIKIAILDEGVETTHPDLSAAVVDMYDAMDGDAWQEPMPWDSHGTNCAGLAAAVPNNQNGIHGIGGGCSLMAVRIAYTNGPKGLWITSPGIIAAGIEWAWKAGADILSNSWGDGPRAVGIINAIERARTLGRNGAGAVVVACSGNEETKVDFPADLPGVLTVSATNQFDEFKTKTTPDGQTWWGSNFGPEVDVAAPGVLNITTDNQRPHGYDPTSDYAHLDGTSASTPIVAGACGLLLSAEPTLTEQQVKDLIRKGADKVGQYPYKNGRNDQMGHGRLNVRRSVELLLKP